MSQKVYSAEEVAGFDAKRLKEVELETRERLAILRMEVFKGQNPNSVSEKRGLRKTLARVLTVVSSKRKESKGVANERH